MGKKGDPADDCAVCVDKKKAARTVRDDRKRKEREGDDAEDGRGAEENKIPVLDFGELLAEDFLEIVAELEVPYNICARISVSGISPKAQAIEQRKRADRLAQAIGEAQFMHWNHEKWYKRKRTDEEVHSYSCAQSASREQKAKVPRGEKGRASRRMERSECGGWLHITADAKSDVMTVCMKHGEQHKPYKDIGVPGKWKKLVRKYASALTPGKIWREIVRRATKGRKATEPGTALPFRQKSIYYYWQLVTREEWRRGSKAFDSARTFIEEKGDQHNIKLLDVPAEPGTEALGFYVTDFVEGWAANAQEIAMDSTSGSQVPPPPEKPMPRVRLLVESRPPINKALTIKLSADAIKKALRVKQDASAGSATDAPTPSDLERACSSAARPSNLTTPDADADLDLQFSEGEESDAEHHWAQRMAAGNDSDDDDEWDEDLDAWDTDGSQVDLGDGDDYRREVTVMHLDKRNIISSPDKAPPSDGVLRERAGGGAGFNRMMISMRLSVAYGQQLKSSRGKPKIQTPASSDHLSKEYPDLKTIAPEELAMHAKARLRGVLEWVSGVEHRHSRRQPEPSRFIGYYYRERKS
ncbi:hypothetical protein C8Q79DRAFT_1107119 [Trametes meyenii]|nr:hypothetical protein C8Q79DRAFT_1107119 [Trametes meyenii]